MQNSEVNEKIIATMQKLGFKASETRLYLRLMEIGPSTIGNLSRKAKVPRTTVYRILDKLSQNGLIAYSFRGEDKVIVAEKPELANGILTIREADLKKRLDELDMMKGEFAEMVKSIHEMMESTNGQAVQVKYFEGISSLRRIYSQILEAQKVVSFVNVNQIINILPENPRLFQTALKQNPKMEMWEIIEDSRESRNSVNNFGDRYHFKFIPRDISFSDIDFIIYDEKVAMININPSNASAIIISSPVMASAMRVIHKLVWDVLPEVTLG